MDITAAVIGFIEKDGVAIGLIVFGIWFLTAKVWPFITGVWWPASNNRAQTQITVIAELSGAVQALKALSQQTVAMLTEHRVMLSEMQILMAERAVSEKDKVESK